jgi:hypothetical protein
MKEQTKHFDERVFKYGMNRMEAQIMLNLAGLSYDI